MPMLLSQWSKRSDRRRGLQWGVAADAEAGTHAGVFVGPFSGHPTLTLKSGEAFMSRMTAGRIWGLDVGDWFMLLGGIAVVGFVALLV
jgi:hypothetical protein